MALNSKMFILKYSTTSVNSSKVVDLISCSRGQASSYSAFNGLGWYRAFNGHVTRWKWTRLRDTFLVVHIECIDVVVVIAVACCSLDTAVLIHYDFTLV